MRSAYDYDNLHAISRKHERFPADRVQKYRRRKKNVHAAGRASFRGLHTVEHVLIIILCDFCYNLLACKYNNHNNNRNFGIL